MINVIILAAGFGTRLKGAGLHIPKGLISYKKTTILGKMVKDLLKADSFKKIILVSNSKFYPQYQKWVKENKLTKKVQIINNHVNEPEKRLGAIGDLIYAIDKMKLRDDILVLPSDTLYKFKIKDFLEFASKHHGLSTAFRYVKNTNIIKGRFGCAEIKENLVVSFEEKPAKPKGHYLAIPFYYYPKKSLRYLRMYKNDGGSLDAPGSIISWFIENKIPVNGFITNNPTLDIGTPKELKQVITF